MAGYMVYVGFATGGSYGTNHRRGQIFYRVSYTAGSGNGNFKTWDGSWKTLTDYWEQSPAGHFGGYATGSSSYRLHPIYDMNSHIYGNAWKNTRGGCNYTLRYPGRLKNYTGSTLYRTLPAGTKIHISHLDGTTGGTSGKALNVIKISGYYNSNGTYVSLRGQSGCYLDEPIGGYYPGSYNINTM